MSSLKYCIGDFDTEVSYQERSGGNTDGFGGETGYTWSEVDTLWCKFEQKSGTERFQDGREISTDRTRFTTTYRSDIKTSGRIVLNSVNYNIRTTDNKNQKSQILIIDADGGEGDADA